MYYFGNQKVFFSLKGRPHHNASNGQIMDWRPPAYCLVCVQLSLGILCLSTFLPSMHALSPPQPSPRTQSCAPPALGQGRSNTSVYV